MFGVEQPTAPASCSLGLLEQYIESKDKYQLSWFRVADGRLYCFKNEKDAQPTTYTPLHSSIITREGLTGIVIDSKFHITRFRAAGSNHRDRWIAALRSSSLEHQLNLEFNELQHSIENINYPIYEVGNCTVPEEEELLLFAKDLVNWSDSSVHDLQSISNRIGWNDINELEIALEYCPITVLLDTLDELQPLAIESVTDTGPRVIPSPLPNSQAPAPTTPSVNPVSYRAKRGMFTEALQLFRNA